MHGMILLNHKIVTGYEIRVTGYGLQAVTCKLQLFFFETNQYHKFKTNDKLSL